MGQRTLGHVLRAAALALVVVGVYAVVVLAIGHVPTSAQWTLVLFSMLAAGIVALLYQPVRAWVDRHAPGHERSAPAEVLRTFQARLTRSIPLDELLLQLAESLRGTLRLHSAEVWVGSAGVLDRAASDPDAGRAGLILAPAEESVLGRAGVV